MYWLGVRNYYIEDSSSPNHVYNFSKDKIKYNEKKSKNTLFKQCFIQMYSLFDKFL